MPKLLVAATIQSCIAWVRTEAAGEYYNSSNDCQKCNAHHHSCANPTGHRQIRTGSIQMQRMISILRIVSKYMCWALQFSRHGGAE